MGRGNIAIAESARTIVVTEAVKALKVKIVRNVKTIVSVGHTKNVVAVSACATTSVLQGRPVVIAAPKPRVV